MLKWMKEVSGGGILTTQEVCQMTVFLKALMLYSFLYGPGG